MARNQGSFGAVLFIGLVLVGFVIAREFFGFDPMPLLRGMHLDVPLVGLLIFLYIDSVQQSFWLDAIDYQHAVFRVADYTPQCEKFTPAMREREKAMARRVDLVLYPSQALKEYVDDLCPAQAWHFRTGLISNISPPPRSRRPSISTSLDRSPSMWA